MACHHKTAFYEKQSDLTKKPRTVTINSKHAGEGWGVGGVCVGEPVLRSSDLLQYPLTWTQNTKSKH